MTYKAYTGVGSRETPPWALGVMRLLGSALVERGLVLRSGGAPGADTAFECGCDFVGGRKEIFLPWKGFEGRKSLLYDIPQQAFVLGEHHYRGKKKWDELTQGVQKLMARNVQQILGARLDQPTAFVLCWTIEGRSCGGTGQAIRVAQAHDIPLFDLGTPGNRDATRIEAFVKKHA